jgi:protein-tyrosine phosphatase
MVDGRPTTLECMRDDRLVLFVCHANVCRSPMAERLGAVAVQRRPGLRSAGLRFASAGTNALADAPMHPPAAQVVGELGGDGSGFRSRTLTASLISQSSVVLTATRGQRAAAVTLMPSAVRRVFTLRQFGRLAATLDAGCLAGVAAASRLAALVDEAPRVRARSQPVAAAEDDLADPVTGTIDDVRACALEIQRALDRVWAVIE